MSTIVRSALRGHTTRFMSIARAKPMMSSMTTVTTVMNSVFPTASQNRESDRIVA